MPTHMGQQLKPLIYIIFLSESYSMKIDDESENFTDK